MADANDLLKLHCDNERTDRGNNFWDPVTVQMKFRFETHWLDAINSAEGKPDIGMKGKLDEKAEDLGYKLVLVGPLVDFYLKNIAKGVKHRLRKSRMTGLMNDFSVLIPFDIVKYICLLWRNYNGRLTVDKGKMSFVATSQETVKKMLSPARFDGSNYLKKLHVIKVRKPSTSHGKKNLEYIPNGRSAVVITENTPFKMIYNKNTGFMKVSFFRQNYTVDGIAEDMTLQGQLNACNIRVT